jgi:hypothetical protein
MHHTNEISVFIQARGKKQAQVEDMDKVLYLSLSSIPNS